MTSEQTQVLIFKDQAGEYYLLPQETLERGRVSEEHKAEVERYLADQGDVQGHILPLLYGVAMTVGFAAGYFGTKSYLEGENVTTPPPTPRTDAAR